MSEACLYGLCRDSGAEIDRLLLEIAGYLRAQALPIEGFVQERQLAPDCSCPGIVLHDLASGAAHDISENRGPGASGCNLDWGALTARAAELEARVHAPLPAAAPAFVIVSRFGKAEAEGRGFRGVIEACLERSVPTLVAYRTAFAPAWARYHGGLAKDLSGNLEAVLAAIGARTAQMSQLR